jgi:hypothetical protein
MARRAGTVAPIFIETRAESAMAFGRGGPGLAAGSSAATRRWLNGHSRIAHEHEDRPGEWTPTRQCHQGEVGAQWGESWAALALKTAQPRFLEVAGRRAWKKNEVGRRGVELAQAQIFPYLFFFSFPFHFPFI